MTPEQQRRELWTTINERLPLNHPITLRPRFSATTQTRIRQYGLLPELAGFIQVATIDCQICGRSIKGKQIVVDHCHLTTLARGFICYPCNYLLGAAKDNPQTLANAVSYLAQPKCAQHQEPRERVNSRPPERAQRIPARDRGRKRWITPDLWVALDRNGRDVKSQNVPKCYRQQL